MKALITKTLLTTAALAAAVATPALAQTTRTQNQWTNPSAFGAESSYGISTTRRPSAAVQQGNVYDTRNQYVGSDPDPSVRDQLSRDPSQSD
jgi:uncharacterized membrane protein